MRGVRSSSRFCVALAASGALWSAGAAAQSDWPEPVSSTPPAPLQGWGLLGAGIYAAAGDVPAFLLKATIEADVPPNRTPSVTSLCPRTRRGLGVDCGTDQYLYARLHAAAAISSTPDGPSVPYVDVHFYPKENQVYAPIPSETDNVIVLHLQFVPAQIGRDTAIDESLTLAVSMGGVAFEDWYPLGSNLAVFVQAPVDFLGYKAVRYASGAAPFDGLRVAGGGVQAGLGWNGWPDLTIRVSAGGRIDYDWNGTRGQSDAAVTGLVTADVGTLVQLFGQPQLVYEGVSGRGWIQKGEVIGGLSLVF